MVSDKKIEFLAKQGFEREIIKMFIDCGIDKNIMWFLTMHKKGSIDNLNGEDLKIINSFIEKTPANTIKKLSYKEVFILANKFAKNEKRKIKNKIYNFENGFYISILNSVDLKEEGEIMSNCVGAYTEKVSIGYSAILALKQPSGKTVAHIEVNKNGLIGQNYSKANSQMSKEYWMMILEFFKNNSKSVDLSDMFGESHIVTSSNGNINEIVITVPTSVNVFLENGVKKSEQIHGFEVKRFMPFQRPTESAVKISSKSEVIEWIKQKKQEINKSYDDLITQVLSTEASEMFLSDNMKEKLFGNKRGAYKMKGEKYDISEIDPRHGMAVEEPILDMEEEVEVEEIDADFDNVAPRLNALINDLNVPGAHMYGNAEEAGEVVDDIEHEREEVEAPLRRPQIILLGRRHHIQADNNLARFHNERAVDAIQDGVQQFLENHPELEERPRLNIEEIPYNEEYEAIAEDVAGNIYGIENVENAMEEGEMEIEGAEGEEGAIAPPEPFNEIMRRAVRR